MKPIEGWDLINEAGEFKRLPAGIYLIQITKVVDNAENKYFEVYCEIVKGEYKDYFKTAAEINGKDMSKSIRSYNDKALPFFKGFITAIEKSNPGYKWDWDESKLVGKYAMAIVGEEEYLKDGVVKTSFKIVDIRSIPAFKEGKLSVPPLKKYMGTTELPTAEQVSPSESIGNPGNIPLLSDDELPF